MQMSRRESPTPFHVDHPDDVALRPLEQLGVGEVRCTMPPQLVLANRQQFRHQVVEQLEDGATTVRISLAGCAYIDSSGLGVLVSISKEAQRRGARLVLERPNDDLAHLLGYTHLDTLFEIER